MLAVFRTELTKQLRRPRTFVALGIAFLIPVVLTIALKANPPSGGPGDQGLLELAPNSGLIVAVAALRFMSRFLLVLIAAVLRAMPSQPRRRGATCATCSCARSAGRAFSAPSSA